MAQERSEVPAGQLILRAMPLIGWISLALLALTLTMQYAAHELVRAASKWADIDASSSIVLSEVGALLNNVARGAALLSLAGTLVTMLLIRPRAVRRRLMRRTSFITADLAQAAMVLHQMETELRNRDEQLQFYDELERLKDAGVEQLVERLTRSTFLGIRATWLAGFVFTVFTVVVALLLR